MSTSASLSIPRPVRPNPACSVLTDGERTLLLPHNHKHDAFSSSSTHHNQDAAAMRLLRELVPTPAPSFVSEESHLGRLCASLVPSHHMRRLVRLSLPSVVGGVLSMMMSAVNLAFVGHRSPTLLGGAALGNAFALITGYTVILGLCSSLDTLCSNAFGAGQVDLMSLTAQRAAVAYTLVCFPIAALWLNTEKALLAAGQDPLISAIAGEYVLYLLPTIFLILYAEVCKRYLQAQAIVAPQIYVMLVANCVHAAAAYILLFVYDAGLKGASLALALGFLVQLIGWLFYLALGEKTERVRCPSLPASWRTLFRGWGPLFRLGIPGMLMLLLEWFSFEVCVLGAGWMGTIELDTLVVFSNVCTLLTMVPLSVATAASTLVGHAVGAANAGQAQRYARAAAGLISAFAVAELFVLSLLRPLLAHVFTSDRDVLHSFNRISHCVLLFVFFDCLQTVCAGVLRGIGAQRFGAVVNFVVYYLVGIPVGFSLAFGLGTMIQPLGVAGLAIGLVASVVSATLIFAIKLAAIDWEEETEKASRRIDEEEETAEADRLSGAEEIEK